MPPFSMGKRENSVEYSPSGSTIKSVNYQSSRQSDEINTFWRGRHRPPAWHSKFTLYQFSPLCKLIQVIMASVIYGYRYNGSSNLWQHCD